MHHNFPNIYFQDPYLELNLFERLLVKIASAGIYGGIAVTAILFASESEPRRQSLALLAILFLLDILSQRIRGERQLGGYLLEELSRGKSMNVRPFFRASTTGMLERALAKAELMSKSTLSLFVLQETIGLAEVERGFLRLGIDRKEFFKTVSDKIKTIANHAVDSAGRDALMNELKTLGVTAFREAATFGETSVSPTALFLGMLELKSAYLDDIFAQFNFSESDFHNAVIFGRLVRGLGRKMMVRRAAVGRKKISHRVMNRAWTARPTPLLDQYSEDLTDLARANVVGFMVGHEAEYQTMVNILSREDKNNAMLVGIAGTGKETVIDHLAFQITRDEVPPKLFDRRLIKLSIASMLSEMKTIGEVQARLEAVVNEIALAGNIVLYLPSIHTLKLTSQAGSINAFDYLKTVFQASITPVVGTTDPQNYRVIIESDPDFKVLFEKIDVQELSPEDALTLLTYESYLIEAKERITISYPALRRTVELAHKYIRQKPLPASAVDLLHEAIAETKNRKGKVLTEQIVADVVARKTKIPVERPKKEEAETLLRLEEKLHERLVNQEEAVKAVSSAMRQYRAGLAREKGPIATFLFAGPTGVGKTELAKTLAAIYFGGEEELVRFDMSEYKDAKSMWNFIGSPDGAVPGNLIEAVKSKPYAVLLLDEFEKAHRDISELFLPIFDEGRTTSSMGETVDLSNMIIIATSNAHSGLIKQEVEKGTAFSEIVDLLKKRLTEYFKPELINRFDAVIAFRQLTPEEIEKIAAFLLSALAKRLEKDQGIVIAIDPSVPKLVAKLGWDPVYGARPLRGVIRNRVREMLAQKILKGEFGRGSRATLKAEGDEIVLEIAKL